MPYHRSILEQLYLVDRKKVKERLAVLDKKKPRKPRISKAEKLLMDALYCFNEMPNKPISKDNIKSTYTLAAKIEKFLKRKHS